MIIMKFIMSFLKIKFLNKNFVPLRILSFYFLSLILPFFILSCRLPVKNITGPPVVFAKTLHVVTDSPESIAVCRAMQNSKIILSRVICSENDSSVNQKTNQLIIVNVTVDLINPTSNFIKNTLKSISMLAAGLFVTVSAGTEFNFTVIHKSNKKNIFQYDKAEMGMWAVLPSPVGLAGTLLGSSLNTYRRPDKLKKSCIDSIEKQNNSLEIKNSLLCQEYISFVTIAYENIEAKLLMELSHDM